MNGGDCYNAVPVTLSEFGDNLAFLSSSPGTLTTMLSSKELTVQGNPLGDGRRAARRPEDTL